MKKHFYDSLNIFRSMIDEVPVFIVGAPRCGTSLLYRILQKHSSFKPTKVTSKTGVNLVESQVFRNPYTLKKSKNARNYMLNNEEEYIQFLQTTLGIRNFQKILLGKSLLHNLFAFTNGNWLFRSLIFTITRSDTLLRSYFYHAKHARGVCRILEKSPNSINFLPEILTTFPKAKLIFLYRHPIDAFTSYKRKLEDMKKAKSNLNKKSIEWLSISPYNFAKAYEKQINLALEAQKLDNNFISISYEKLVENPQAELVKILSFLDETFEETILPRDETNYFNWKPDPELFGSIKVQTKDWKDFVNDGEVEIIEAKLEKIMNRLNYTNKI